MNKSKRDIGSENLAKLSAYLETVDGIPTQGGKANISAIALNVGLDRQICYRPEARQMIANAVARKGLEMPNQQRIDNGVDGDLARAERRVFELEAKLVAKTAEIHALRERLVRYEHIERHMVETGLVPR